MNWFSTMFDERYRIHRYRATSHAAVVGSTLLSAMVLSAFWRSGELRLDLVLVLAAMAITKLVAMIHFARTD